MKPITYNFRLTLSRGFTPSRRRRAGFTLIELLVVIAVLGILASLVLARFSESERQARDTQRKSDLSQYRTALEASAVSNDTLYPSRTAAGGTDASNTLCGDLVDFMGPCPGPEDPRYGSLAGFQYFYSSNGSGGGAADATQYQLWAQLERGGWWVVCSIGKSGEKSTVPSGAGGVCEI